MTFAIIDIFDAQATKYFENCYIDSQKYFKKNFG